MILLKFQQDHWQEKSAGIPVLLHGIVYAMTCEVNIAELGTHVNGQADRKNYCLN